MRYDTRMGKSLKLIPIGNSTGVILPKDMLAHLRVTQGDALYWIQAPDGSYRVTPSNPDFERQMAAAEEIMKSDRDILRTLSK